MVGSKWVPERPDSSVVVLINILLFFVITFISINQLPFRCGGE